MKTPKAKLVLETRVPLKKQPGTFPVVLQFYFERRRVFLSTGIGASLSEFEKILRPSPRDPKLRAYKYQLEELVQNAEYIIKKLGGNFTLEKARMMMETGAALKKRQTDIASVFSMYISNLELNEQIRTADSYRNAMRSLMKFDPTLDFEKLTSESLEEFEDWMVNLHGKSKTTVGIYLRSLKAVFNFAVQEKIIDGNSSPFGKGKYIIPTGKNTKKALTLEQIRQIYDYKTIPGTSLDKAKDYFMFSYFVNGINFRDIVDLKNKDLKDGQINFVRAKTVRTKRDHSTIKSLLRKEAIDIIEKWRNKDRNPDTYLFPVLIPGLSAKQIARKVQDFIKETNLGLSQIGQDLGITFPLTTYVARHSFATIALNHGNVPLPTISAALGHSTIETTKSYLDSLDDKNLKNISDSLL